MNLRQALARLGGESIVYGLGQAGTRLIQVALVPILTRVFSPDAYGVIDLVTLVASVAAPIAVCGMDAALARFFYEAPDTQARRSLASTSAVHRFASGTILGAALFLLAEPLSSVVLGSPEYAKYLRLIAAALPFGGLFLFANEALRVTFQPWKYVALNVLNLTLVGVLTLWFVLRLELSVAGVFWAKLFGDAVAALAGLVLVRHSLGGRFDGAALCRMLAYGAPLLPVALTYAALTYADRQVLLHTASLEEVGVYAAAAKVAAIVMLPVTAFTLAFGPFAFAAAREAHAGRLYSRVLTLYTAAGSALALGIGAFAPEILRVAVPETYWGAGVAAGFLAFGTIAHGAYYIAALGTNLAQRNGWLIVTTGVAAVLTVVCALAWVRPFGSAGVAAATLCGFTFSTVSLYLVSQRLRRFPYLGARCLVLFATAIAVFVVIVQLPAGSAGAVGKGLGWLAFTAIALAFAWYGKAPLPDSADAGKPEQG
jgi:O-antigen/teichoic acid export membrane protein